jgi:hypothetical protein
VTAWAIYLRAGLTLSHYDAKAHLVVARRVIDSLTPGWQQLGAVWLPLPHLIQLLPTQIDLFYRTGAFASAVSIAAFAVTVWAASTLVLRITGSAAGAATVAALFILNPNLLYLQSTPMTEPLLLAIVFLVVLRLHEWVALAASGPADAEQRYIRRTLGWTLFAAAWTRYEAWPVIVAGLAGAAFAMWRRADSPALISARLARAAVWPAAAALLFALNSRVTVGSWLVDGGFYEIDPQYDGRAWRSLVAVWWGTHRLSGYAIETVGLATAVWLTMRALTRREAATLLLPVALLAAAALPFYAFFQGHPYRVRYMVPATAACLFFCGLAVGALWRPVKGRPTKARDDGDTFGRRFGPYAPAILAVILIASSLIESPPFGSRAPLIEEAQWDVPRSVDRRAVTACLASAYRGELVMASMGSLAHYMQELSHEGFAIADFLHEGNGTLWELAMETGPALHVGWMLLEEQSEGGDVLTRRVRNQPDFARGMRRVCEGGGVALYKRD